MIIFLSILLSIFGVFGIYLIWKNKKPRFILLDECNPPLSHYFYGSSRRCQCGAINFTGVIL
jgi:hypothetical protein